MHELSIAMGILELTEEESEKRGGVRVDAIHLRLGPLSGVVKEALLSAWQLASEQTEFESSRLVIEDVPIAVFCSKCQAERPVQSIQRLCCVECDAPATEVVRGRELLVSALELAE
jgi:hydrogenase nickel incorporation protein HypA/HybF